MAMVESALNRWFVVAGMILVLSAAIYGEALDAPFVLDDTHTVLQNEAIRDLPAVLKNAFKLTRARRPVTEISLSLDYHLYGIDVRGYHLTSWGIHVAVCLLVFFTIRLFLSFPKMQKTETWPGRDLLPAAVALITAVHPLQTQAVIYVAQRATLLVTFFYIGAVFCYLRARRLQQEGKPLFTPMLLFAAGALSGMLAMASKQNAASLPLVILMVELVLIENPWQRLKRNWTWLLPAAVVVTGMVLWAGSQWAGGGLGALFARLDQMTRETTLVTRWEYFLTQLNVIPRYLLLVIWPAGQNVDPMVPFKRTFLSGLTPLFAVFLASLLISGFAVARKRPLVSVGILWVFISLIIESSVFPIKDAMFEHRMYLAMPGAVLALMALLLPVLTRLKIGFYGVVLLALILSAASFQRTQVWGSPVDLWSDVFKKVPHNFRAANNLANALVGNGQDRLAIRYYQESIRLNRDYPYPYLGLGRIMARDNQLGKAEKLLLKALEYYPGSRETSQELIDLYMKKGDVDSAIQYLNRHLMFPETRAETFERLGVCYLMKGEPQAGIASFTKSLQLNQEPGPKLYYNLAAAHAMAGDAAAAGKWLSEAGQRGMDWASAVRRDARFSKVIDQLPGSGG